MNREPKGWWESLTPGVNGSAPHDVYLYDEFEFKYMGLENPEETQGIVASGTSETTNLVADGRVILRLYVLKFGFQRVGISAKERIPWRQTTLALQLDFLQ